MLWACFALIAIITLKETSFARYRNAAPHQATDKLSGALITTFTLLVGIAGIIENLSLHRTLQNPSVALGTLIFIAGYSLRHYATGRLKENFNYAVAPIKTDVYTKGLYSKIRHPAYAGTIFYAIGLAIAFSAFSSWILALLSIFSVMYRIRTEERFLLSTNPSYSEYMKTTRKLIPFIY